MSFRIVLRGEEPSGRFLAVLCARTGRTIDSIKASLASRAGLALAENLSAKEAEALKAALPEDDSVTVLVKRDVETWIAVLVGYRPGSRGRLRTALQKLSGLSTEEVIHFLSSIPIALKSGVDRKTAMAVKEIIEREGGIIEVRPQPGLVRSSRPSAPVRRPVAQKKDPSPEDKLDDSLPGRAPEVPPKISRSRREAGTSSSPAPPVLHFQRPDRVSVPAPPLVADETGAELETEAPHSFYFTIPWAAVPAVVDPSGAGRMPRSTEQGEAVPIYLHPVSRSQRGPAAEAIQRILGIDPREAIKLMNGSPAVLCLFRERINALVTLRELSESGVPVSLVCSGVEEGEENRGTSFFGWLNGTG